jgi:hypothetical protein
MTLDQTERRYTVYAAVFHEEQGGTLEEIAILHTDTRSDAFGTAHRIARDERTYTLVRDNHRTSRITGGPRMILMVEESGRVTG